MLDEGDNETRANVKNELIRCSKYKLFVRFLSRLIFLQNRRYNSRDLFGNVVFEKAKNFYIIYLTTIVQLQIGIDNFRTINGTANDKTKILSRAFEPFGYRRRDIHTDPIASAVRLLYLDLVN